MDVRAWRPARAVAPFAAARRVHVGAASWARVRRRSGPPQVLPSVRRVRVRVRVRRPTRQHK